MSILNLFPLGLQEIRRQKPALYLVFSHIAHFFGCAKLPQNKQNCIVAIYIYIYTNYVKTEIPLFFMDCNYCNFDTCDAPTRKRIYHLILGWVERC